MESALDKFGGHWRRIKERERERNVRLNIASKGSVLILTVKRPSPVHYKHTLFGASCLTHFQVGSSIDSSLPLNSSNRSFPLEINCTHIISFEPTNAL